ncbi:MAG TPA: YtxH domain-containing protein, partial [Gemmatimonadaceae bacterium]|nr:YtxH domain-containing protein [Gemmatimonadaceae bacterium]
VAIFLPAAWRRDMPRDRDLDEVELGAGSVGHIDETFDDVPEDEEWDEEEEGEDEVDEEWFSSGAWRQTGLATAGLVFGLALGAGLALLFAPRSGDETRELIGERARLLRGRAGDRFDDLREELGHTARRGRRRVRRGMTRGMSRGRWAAEDMLSRAGW